VREGRPQRRPFFSGRRRSCTCPVLMSFPKPGGRNTLEVVAKLSSWPYHGKRIVVLSHRPLKFSEINVPVEQMSGEPAHRPKSLCRWCQARLCRWRFDNSGIPACWPDPRSHDHARTCINWGRHSFVRMCAKRHQAPAHQYPSVQKWPSDKSIRGNCVANPNGLSETAALIGLRC